MPNFFQKSKLNDAVKAALLLFISTIIIYSNSLGGEFVYDDQYFIVKNVHIRNLENIPSFFVSPSAVAFADLAQDVYRPLTTISYTFDYHFWGLDAFGYHLENVLLHASNAILLFILLSLIFGDIAVAFLASLLFACHPVQTEVVSWVSGRSSALFLFFYLASFIFYALFTKKQKKIYLALSLILYFKSLFSKEMAVSLPLLLVLYDIHFAPGERLKRKILKFTPYFLLAAFFVASRFMILNRVSQCDWWGGGPYYTFLTMMAVIGEYLKILILPVKLCAFYVTDIQTSILTHKVLLPAVGLIILIGALPSIFKRSREASFAICLFFVTLLPVSNVVPLKALMAERFLYLPSIGFCMLVATILAKLARNTRGIGRANAKRAAMAIAVMLVLAYSARTMIRNEDWKNPVTITNSILKLDPLNPWALTALGVAYSDQGQYEKAIEPLTRAIMASKEYFSPRNALGFCYVQLGRNDDAIKILTDALKIKPHHLESLSSLGVAYAQSKRYPEAIRQFELAVKVDPSFMNGYINLGAAYDQMGEPGKAIEIYARGAANTRATESMAIMYIRTGDVYKRLKKYGIAEEYYLKAMKSCGPRSEELKKVITDRLAANK